MPGTAVRIFAGQATLISEFTTGHAPPVDRNLPVALRAFEAWLNRAPLLSDLNTATLFDWECTLIDRGVSRQTVDRYGYSLRRLARAAVAAGLLEDVPRTVRWRARFTTAKTVPWSAENLTTLFGAVRTLRGTVSGHPAATWWTALLLASIDCCQPAAPLLALPGPAFDPAAGTLAIGMYVYSLHPRTVAALAELKTVDAPRLLRWELDESASAGNPFYMLLYDLRKILSRAGLPSTRFDLFGRLRATGENDPQVLDRIDWEFRFPLPHGADESPAALELSMKPRRRRGNPKWAAAGELQLGSNAKKRKASAAPDVYLIENPSDRTIRHFFETVYVPRRLAYGSKGTIVSYRCTLNRLKEYCLTDCTLDALRDDGQLTGDDLIEKFLAWYRPLRAVDSLKRMRGELLAVWRYAWKKRRVETLPRDIDEIRTPKRLPESWSIDDLDRLLTVAGSVEGTVCGIPASLYWPALIMFFVESGLRKSAAMQVTVQNFDAERGWVRVEWETQKQKASQDIPLSEQTVRLILATRPAGRELLFDWPFRDAKKTLDIRLRALLRQAGLPCGRRDLWHRFRRTCATFTADVAGEIEAQKLLGHASIATTRKYLDVRKLRRARIVDNPALQRPAWKPRGLLGQEGQANE